MTQPRVIDLPGEPRARGAAHGEELREVIADALERWYESLPAEGPPREWVRRFVATTDFRTAMAQSTPDLLDEIAGLATGAGVDEQTMFAFQLVDEQWCYARVPADHCSVVGGAARIAQNLDLPDWWNGLQTVLRVPAWRDQPGFVAITGAGFLAMNGLNDAGVAVVVNALPDVPAAREGLPVVAAVRGVLGRRSAADAGDFLERVGHASGQHYLLADGAAVVALECDAEGTAEVRPAAGVVVHTNHAVSRPSQPELLGDSAGGALANSSCRLDFLVDLAPALAAGDHDAICQALSDETVPIRRAPTDISPSSTFATVVFETGAAPVMHVRGGTGEEAFLRVDVTRP